MLKRSLTPIIRLPLWNTQIKLVMILRQKYDCLPRLWKFHSQKFSNNLSMFMKFFQDYLLKEKSCTFYSNIFLWEIRFLSLIYLGKLSHLNSDFFLTCEGFFLIVMLTRNRIMKSKDVIMMPKIYEYGKVVCIWHLLSFESDHKSGRQTHFPGIFIEISCWTICMLNRRSQYSMLLEIVSRKCIKMYDNLMNIEICEMLNWNDVSDIYFIQCI